MATSSRVKIGPASAGAAIAPTRRRATAALNNRRSAVCGAVTLTQMRWLNRMVAEIEAEMSGRADRRFQFSLRGLLLATLVAGLVAAIARQLAARPEVLAAIYLFGPFLLVLLAMLPRGISWQQRVGLLTPATLVLIAVAVAVGNAIGLEFDRVLLGISVCWIPQSALAAVIITVATLAVYYRRLSKTSAT